MAYGTVSLIRISDKRLSETFFHPVCAVIQQVHSPVIWHCGTGATSLIEHRCRSMQQDSFGGIPALLIPIQDPVSVSLSLIGGKYFRLVLQ